MKFPFYLPWGKEQSDFVMSTATSSLYAIDLQLGSVCNAMCPRCDSSCCDLDEPAAIDVEAVGKLAEGIAAEKRRLWDARGADGVPDMSLGFVCGLGEPTAAHNLIKLKAIIERTADYRFTWSMFANGIHWDSDLDDFLRNGYLSVLVQYNSRKLEVVADMMGIGEKRAETQMRNTQYLFDLMAKRSSHFGTHVAASIVPDADNVLELPYLVDEAVSHNVFPLIGELENAGHSKGDYYETHKLPREELDKLHAYIFAKYGFDYVVPYCPAAIGAIHINNRNIVTVDEFTGLSCGWFGMGDPKVHEIGDIREMSYQQIVGAILDYRKSRVPAVRAAINDYPDMTFGGCGGNARDLLTAYVGLY